MNTTDSSASTVDTDALTERLTTPPDPYFQYETVLEKSASENKSLMAIHLAVNTIAAGLFALNGIDKAVQNEGGSAAFNGGLAAIHLVMARRGYRKATSFLQIEQKEAAFLKAHPPVFLNFEDHPIPASPCVNEVLELGHMERGTSKELTATSCMIAAEFAHTAVMNLHTPITATLYAGAAIFFASDVVPFAKTFCAVTPYDNGIRKFNEFRDKAPLLRFSGTTPHTSSMP